MTDAKQLIDHLNTQGELCDEAIENYRHRIVVRAYNNGMGKEDIAMLLDTTVELVDAYIATDPDTLPFLNSKL